MQHLTWRMAYPSHNRLSVSSVGSEAMQPNPTALRRFFFPDFQYPRSDRRRCNDVGQDASDPMTILSVSSVGSEAMQPSIWAGQMTGY